VGNGFTVTSLVVKQAGDAVGRNVIVAVPPATAIPFTTPPPLIVATDVLELAQVPAILLAKVVCKP
jgi:hypothetical protein